MIPSAPNMDGLLLQHKFEVVLKDAFVKIPEEEEERYFFRISRTEGQHRFTRLAERFLNSSQLLLFVTLQKVAVHHEERHRNQRGIYH